MDKILELQFLAITGWVFAFVGWVFVLMYYKKYRAIQQFHKEMVKSVDRLLATLSRKI